MTSKRKPVDWEAVEREYRAGQLSVSEIGRQHGVSHTAINKRAKAQGWTRNLAAKVKEAVSARLVSDGVSATNARETIDAAAARVVDVVRSHRGDISRGRKLLDTLMTELDEASDPENRETIDDEIEDATKGGDAATYKRRSMMRRAVALPSRASVLINLANAAKTLIQLERQAFSIDDDGGDDTERPAVDLSDEALAAIAAGSRRGAAEA